MHSAAAEKRPLNAAFVVKMQSHCSCCHRPTVTAHASTSTVACGFSAANCANAAVKASAVNVAAHKQTTLSTGLPPWKSDAASPKSPRTNSSRFPPPKRAAMARRNTLPAETAENCTPDAAHSPQSSFSFSSSPSSPSPSSSRTKTWEMPVQKTPMQ